NSFLFALADLTYLGIYKTGSSPSYHQLLPYAEPILFRHAAEIALDDALQKPKLFIYISASLADSWRVPSLHITGILFFLPCSTLPSTTGLGWHPSRHHEYP